MRPTFRRAALALGAVLSVAGARTAAAQNWRTFEASRQLRDSVAVRVHVTYGAGRFLVRRGTDALLYRAQLRYDGDRSEPLYRYDAGSHALSIGLRRDRGALPKKSREQGELRLDLSPRVPMDLTLELGATEADLQLGGLAIEELSLETGASEARVHFDSVSATRMRRLELRSGAASLGVDGIANASPERMRVETGVGGVDLDFGGAWRNDTELDVQMALGSLSVRVPRDVGVRVEIDRFLSSFDHEGLVKRDGAWVSENWDSATHHLRITGTAALGSLSISRQ